jgi:phage-related protein
MVHPTSKKQPKPVRWVGSGKEDLRGFQKKSKRGVAMPKAELDLIEQRLKRAKEDYEQ